jgi:hypothetical protein
LGSRRKSGPYKRSSQKLCVNDEKPASRYYSGVDERIGDFAPVENRNWFTTLKLVTSGLNPLGGHSGF